MRALLFMLGALLLSACVSPRAQLTERAAAGDARAQYECGRCLLTGQRGFEKNPEAAVGYLRSAAGAGYAPAEAALALCAEHGMGTDTDPAEAKRLYRRAADQGHRGAMLGLASMEPKKAPQILKPLAEGDDAEMQLLLGKLYISGMYGKKNIPLGLRYLRYAAAVGDGEACMLLSACYAMGRGVPANDALMLGWLQSAAEAGNPQALLLIRSLAEEKQ